MAGFVKVAGEGARPLQASQLAAGDIPDVHTATVAERRISVDLPGLIANNVRTEMLALDLDGEWDGVSVVCNFRTARGEVWQVRYGGEPVAIPAEAMAEVGPVDLSVVGYSPDGEMRLVTAESKGTFQVEASGYVDGEAPPEATPDLLGQLVAAADAATGAVSAAQGAQAAYEALQDEAEQLIEDLGQVAEDHGMPLYVYSSVDEAPTDAKCAYFVYDEVCGCWALYYEDGKPEGGDA